MIVMGHWTLTMFYFILFYFFWFYFSFSLFYFPGETMKKARDKEVTWQVTWCDVIGLECQDCWRWTLFYFLFSFLFYFSFLFLFLFLFLEQLRLGFISHTVTSVTNWWHSHKTDHGTQENGVEDSGIKWYHTAWTTHAGLM